MGKENVYNRLGTYTGGSYPNAERKDRGRDLWIGRLRGHFLRCIDSDILLCSCLFLMGSAVEIEASRQITDTGSSNWLTVTPSLLHYTPWLYVLISKLVPHPQLLEAAGFPTILNWLPISSIV